MKKKVFLIGLCLMIALMAISQNSIVVCSAGDSSYEGFRVEGRHLYDTDGNKVTLIGINSMILYYDQTGRSNYPNIARTGANVCRIYWKDDSKTAIEDLDRTIQNCIDNQMIPMPSLWNATGNWNQLQACVDFWLSRMCRKL